MKVEKPYCGRTKSASHHLVGGLSRYSVFIGFHLNWCRMVSIQSMSQSGGTKVPRIMDFLVPSMKQRVQKQTTVAGAFGESEVDSRKSLGPPQWPCLAQRSPKKAECPKPMVGSWSQRVHLGLSLRVPLFSSFKEKPKGKLPFGKVAKNLFRSCYYETK